MKEKAKTWLIVQKLAPGLKVEDCSEYSEIALGDRPLVLGRPTDDSVPDIKITGDRRISREHVRISYDPDRNCFILCDRNSKWGTYLNDELMEKGREYVLELDQRIGLAATEDGGVLVELSFITHGGTVPRPEWVVAKGVAYLCGRKLKIRPAEWKVFEVLYNNSGQPCSIDKILILGWPEGADNPDKYPGNSAIEQYIHRLREEIEPEPNKPRYIQTVAMSGQDKKHGYKLVLD